ncbi:hypothetical protein [Pedobacter alpinus]|uniref:Uncharacterized protein n=1 Tax=Pedobacter alpinus TaxID=1590643 RepID=A0ABW5TX49_9SPHI
MYLKKILLFVTYLLFTNNSSAQMEAKSSANDFAKFIEKNYRSTNEIWKICNKNYAVIYFDFDENNKVKKYMLMIN